VRIGLDGKVLTLSAGGTGRYSINLMRAMLAAAGEYRPELEFVIFTGPRTSRAVMKEFDGACDECYLGAKSSLLRSLALIPPALRRQRIDVFHGIDHVGIPFAGRTGKYVVTIHDVIPLILPRTFTARHRAVVRLALARVRRRADRVIVPSHAVKQDVVQHLGLAEDLVTVTHHGCEPRFHPRADPEALRAARARYGLPSRYVLAVGTLEPRKNLTTLLQAFARLREDGAVDPGLRLVLAGARGWLDEPIFRTVRSFGLEEVVCFPGFVDDDDLPELYRGAELFVFPSLYEGFGLPPLEAMACGVPVVTSNTSSMPEVAGGAAMLVDPLDVGGMAAAIARVLREERLRARLRAAGVARARQFSWETSARQVLDTYAALVRGAAP
jgi:glycosyltransferase involved in cell wall biosynthesis